MHVTQYCRHAGSQVMPRELTAAGLGAGERGNEMESCLVGLSCPGAADHIVNRRRWLSFAANPGHL
jgi:hypothetical protein